MTVCCKGCGRDTRRPDGYCWRCIGHGGSARDKDRRASGDNEDRYDEESGPDDVSDDEDR